jgi:hypothetical protein
MDRAKERQGEEHEKKVKPGKNKMSPARIERSTGKKSHKPLDSNLMTTHGHQNHQTLYKITPCSWNFLFWEHVWFCFPFGRLLRFVGESPLQMYRCQTSPVS